MNLPRPGAESGWGFCPLSAQLLLVWLSPEEMWVSPLSLHGSPKAPQSTPGTLDPRPVLWAVPLANQKGAIGEQRTWVQGTVLVTLCPYTCLVDSDTSRREEVTLAGS